MRELLQMLEPASSQRKWMLLGILLGLVVIITNTLLMALSGWFITSMAVAGVANASFNYFFASATIRALAIARTVGRYGERLVTHEATFRMLADLRVWFFKRLIPLAPAGIEAYAGSDLSGRLRADLDSLESLYLRILAPLATGLLTILLSCLFVAIWSGTAALLLLIILLLAGLLLPYIGLRLNHRAGAEAAALAGELRNQAGQGLQGAEELLLLGAVEQQSSQVERLSSELIKRQIWLGRVAALTNAAVLLLSGTCLVLLCLLLIPLVGQQSLTGPNLVMLLLFSAACFEAVGPLSLSLQQLPAASEAARRIRQLIDTKPALPEPVISVEPKGLDICISNVSFGYHPQQLVLKSFSLNLVQGQRVAVVGKSGSGKSSLIELLSRFRPYQGSIRLGGVEITDLTTEQLTGMIAIVPQHPHLFNASIRDNILLGRDCDPDRLVEILRVCCLEQWLLQLPQGLDTEVGERGFAISGGEGRRIALARGLVADRPILLLDEPTEGLDSLTEQLLIKGLDAYLKGKTMLLVSHRPACLELVDRVIPIPFQGDIFVGSSSAPQRTACTPSSPISSPP